MTYKRANGDHKLSKPRSLLQALGTRGVTWNKFHNDSPKYWTNLRALLSSGAFCSVHVNWHTILHVIKKINCNYYAKNIGSHHTKLAVVATRQLGLHCIIPYCIVKLCTTLSWIYKYLTKQRGCATLKLVHLTLWLEEWGFIFLVSISNKTYKKIITLQFKAFSSLRSVTSNVIWTNMREKAEVLLNLH